MKIDDYDSFRAFLRPVDDIYYFTDSCVEHSRIEFIGEGFRTIVAGKYNTFPDSKDRK
ncbi:TPA: hypothetical protein KOC32_003849 [Clostridioides difficile]|nr:hypothetical protein [Clostridioides difficile]